MGDLRKEIESKLAVISADLEYSKNLEKHLLDVKDAIQEMTKRMEAIFDEGRDAPLGYIELTLVLYQTKDKILEKMGLLH